MSFGHIFSDKAEPISEQIFYRGGINAKTVGDTLIFTTANDTSKFIVTSVELVWEAITSPSTNAVVDVGHIGAIYSDVVSAGGIPGMTLNEYAIQTINVNANSIPANTGLYLRISTAATGTTLTIGCYVKGFYRY